MFRMGLGFGVSRAGGHGPPRPSIATLFGVKAAWNLDEAPGTRLDAYGTNDQTPTGSVLTALGKVNTAAVFDGSTGYLSCASNADLQTGDVDFWVAAWVYPDTYGTGYPTVAAKGTDEFNLYVTNDGRANFRLNYGAGSDVVTGTGAVPLGQWSLILAWRDKASGKVYLRVNGGPTYSATYAAATAGSSAFYLGTNAPATNLWDGMIGPVVFGKPPGPIADVIDRIHLTAWNGGFGQAWPWTEITRNTVASDTFTGANGTNLTAHTMDVGGPWVIGDGAVEIQGNKALCTGTSSGIWVDTGCSDVVVKVTTDQFSKSGALVRVGDISNFFMARCENATTLVIYEVTAGSYTIRASATGSFTLPVPIEFSACGDQLSVTAQGATASYTTTLRQTNTKHGIQPSLTVSTFDTFSVQDYGTPNFDRYTVAATFTAVDGTSLDGWVPDKGAAFASGSGDTWVTDGGRAKCTTEAAPGEGTLLLDAAIADGIVSASITNTASGSWSGLYCRADSTSGTSNGYVFLDEGSDAGVIVYDGATPLGSASVTTTGTHTVSALLSGTVLTMLVDGVRQIAVTDPSWPTQTVHGFYGRSANTGLRFDNFTIQAPIVIVRATFTAPDGTPLTAYTPEQGGPFTVIGGTPTIQGGMLVYPGSGGGWWVAYDDYGTPDYTIRFNLVITDSSQIGGFAFRFVDAANYWQVNLNNTAGYGIYEYTTAGGQVGRALGSYTFGVGVHPVKITLSGSIVSVDVNGTVIHYDTMSSGLSATKGGPQSFGGTPAKFDNLEVTIP